MASGIEDAADDERWLVVDGRRWRRTDPALPDEVTARLRSHLGRARAAVRTTRRAGDDEGTTSARHRVGLAKAGLGERGPRWWDDDVPARMQRAREALAELDRVAPPRADPPADVNA
ncbi:biopolymer transporter Tol [uncultured Microbacterium sp.]|uniref:biopolymer transporter Tol n=1 Tax=uncultured Microbacterium sp. TaxID=191216 RepID=UPI0025EBCA12|nr:biopolymer transporter Tol [uncultured Microbacterium sp.]